MAVIKVLTRKNNIKGLIKYVENPHKSQNGLLVSGKDCSVPTCYDEMETVKNIFNKKDGYTAFHFIQSFSPDDNLSYKKAHEIGLQFAEYFKGFQVLVATHTDREHLHNHFVINSVSFENGKKFHIGKKDLEEIKKFSNKLCEENGLKTIDLEHKNEVKDIGKNEYAVANKGQSWKFKLMNDIDYCMSISNTKDEYIKNMESLNYKVVWTNTRKYITYTTPDGQKCRDKSLHDKKYLKESMEYGFRRNEKNESEFNRTNANEETETRDKTSDRVENRIDYSTNGSNGQNLWLDNRDERYVQENGFENTRSADTRTNRNEINQYSGEDFIGQGEGRTSLPNAGVQSSIRRCNQKQEKIRHTGNIDRNCDRYCCNYSLETLRHLAHLFENMTYVGPTRTISHCFGDLSKQARKEWYLEHRNSDSFDWFEDDFEI